MQGLRFLLNLVLDYRQKRYCNWKFEYLEILVKILFNIWKYYLLRLQTRFRWFFRIKIWNMNTKRYWMIVLKTSTFNIIARHRFWLILHPHFQRYLLCACKKFDNSLAKPFKQQSIILIDLENVRGPKICLKFDMKILENKFQLVFVTNRCVRRCIKFWVKRKYGEFNRRKAFSSLGLGMGWSCT